MCAWGYTWDNQSPLPRIVAEETHQGASGKRRMRHARSSPGGGAARRGEGAPANPAAGARPCRHPAPFFASSCFYGGLRLGCANFFHSQRPNAATSCLARFLSKLHDALSRYFRPLPRCLVPEPRAWRAGIGINNRHRQTLVFNRSRWAQAWRLLYRRLAQMQPNAQILFDWLRYSRSNFRAG